MPALQELIDKRAQVWESMKEIMERSEKAGTMSAEDQAAYDKAEKDINPLDAQINTLERHAQRSAAYDKVDRSSIVAPPTSDKDERGGKGDADQEQRYARAFDTFLRFGMEGLESDERKMVRAAWRTDSEARAQSTVTTAGGYLVPEGYRNKLIERMKDFGAVQAVAEVLQTDSGNPLPWPTNDDTGNVGALLAENTQDSEQDLTLGTAQLGAYKYTSKITRVSIELLQDSAVDLDRLIPRKHGERIGRILNQHFTTGTGTNQPQGIVTGATSGVTAAAVAAITGDELISLQHSVDPAYRNARSRFMLSDTALMAVRKLKDGNNAYLWQPSVQAGVPSTLLGAGYVINQDMAVPAAAVKSVLYGDFEAGYVVRIVRGIQAIRLTERYADFFQVGFVSFCRADGRTQDANAYKALTQAAV